MNPKWPKVFPPLTPEQVRISDDFMEHWHGQLASRFGIIETFNHGYPVKHRPPDFVRTLEVGAGLGEHLRYERLTDEQRKNYVALEIRQNMAAQMQSRFPDIQIWVGDCQQTLPCPDDHFDRIVAVHVLEHLPNLPAAVRELYRVCNKRSGTLSVVIPCEGGMAYSLARKISAQRIFEKRYGQSYDWLIKREHLSTADEVTAELSDRFRIVHRRYFPIPIPFVFCNLVIGLTLRPRASA
jgi:ubiquinone/menaquinone biosynthesis C-methylase UbiE